MLALQDKIEARHKVSIDLAFRAETQFRKEGAVSMKTGLGQQRGTWGLRVPTDDSDR